MKQQNCHKQHSFMVIWKQIDYLCIIYQKSHITTYKWIFHWQFRALVCFWNSPPAATVPAAKNAWNAGTISYVGL